MSELQQVRAMWNEPGGQAVLVFSHPCFPQDYVEAQADSEQVSYRWPFPYFAATRALGPPWGHFKTDFIWFHRPLSDYWKAFRNAGFSVVEFEELRITPERYHLAETERALRSARAANYERLRVLDTSVCKRMAENGAGTP